MPSKRLIRVQESPYHVTARCNNKEPFKGPLEMVWNIFTVEINEIIKKYDCKIHAFVLMPNHFHLLITTPKDDLGVIMQTFMVTVTQKINLISGRSGRVFGGRYHWSLIDDHQYYDCALKYIYRNPVKAKLSERVEDYPFSTINSVLENHFINFKIEPAVGLQGNIPHEDAQAFLLWLNQPFQGEQEGAIKKGFQKSRFNPPRSGWKRDRVVPESFSSMNMTR